MSSVHQRVANLLLLGEDYHNIIASDQQLIEIMCVIAGPGPPFSSCGWYLHIWASSFAFVGVCQFYWLPHWNMACCKMQLLWHQCTMLFLHCQLHISLSQSCWSLSAYTVSNRYKQKSNTKMLLVWYRLPNQLSSTCNTFHCVWKCWCISKMTISSLIYVAMQPIASSNSHTSLQTFPTAWWFA